MASLQTRDLILQTRDLIVQTRELNMQTKDLNLLTKIDSVNEKIDAISLFTVVQDVLNHAIFVAEKHFLVQGKQEQAVSTGNNRISISSCSWSILKRIACKVGCNATIEEVINSVLHLLSNYSWAEKAVLTLAAFAMVYEELLFYVDSREHPALASSISSQMRVDVLIRQRQDNNFQQAIVDLNVLTRISIKMIAHILEFENMSTQEYDRMDSSAVRLVAETRDVACKHSFVVIQSVMACMAQVNYLNYDGVPKLELSRWISVLKENLDEQEKWHKKIDDLKAYGKLVSFFHNPTGISELIIRLMHSSDGLSHFYDCHSKQPVNIDVVKEKNVLLFISGLEISQDDFSALLDVHRGQEKHDDYKIVWIPIVDQWDVISTQKFSSVVEKMEWYAILYRDPIIGIKYIKNVWHFCYNPMVVVFNPQGRIACNDAMQMIKLWRNEGFPFIPERQGDLITSADWLSLFFSHNLKIKQEVEKGSYIFFYGGNDEWIKAFRQKVEKLVQFVAKDQISIASFTIQNIQGHQDHNLEIGQFWTIIESLYHLKIQWDQLNVATKEIQKLLTYKKDKEGWALVYRKGPTPVTISASGAVIALAVEELLAQGPLPQLAFGVQLTNYIKRIEGRRNNLLTCYQREVGNSSGSPPLQFKFPFRPAKL